MTTGTRSRPPTVEQTIRRAVGYELLARCLGYPDDPGTTAMRDSAGMAAPVLAGSELEAVVEAALDASPRDLEERHVQLFSLSSSPDCPTFETAFLSADHLQMSERMADVAGFYRAFGVDTRGSAFRPDDICVELEFMGFLCRKQAYAAEHLGAPRVAQVLKAQRLFLRDHLGRWGGAVGRRMALRSYPGSFYATVGQALESWLAADADLIGAGPIEAVEIPEPKWIRPDDEPGGPSEDLIGFDDIPVM